MTGRACVPSCIYCMRLRVCVWAREWVCACVTWMWIRPLHFPDSLPNLLSRCGLGRFAAAMTIPILHIQTSSRKWDTLMMSDVSRGRRDGSLLDVRGNADWSNWASYRFSLCALHDVPQFTAVFLRFPARLNATAHKLPPDCEYKSILPQLHISANKA